jgi:carboxyl-terminal processing protease
LLFIPFLSRCCAFYSSHEVFQVSAYDQLLLNLHEQTNEDVIRDFLTTLALTYDPHSEYLSKSDLENFSINMRLSLVGIGAVLRSDDGYAKIAELVPAARPSAMAG